MDKWAEFQKAHRRPAPGCFRVNGFKSSPGEINDYFNSQGIKLEQSEYFDNIYYWTETCRAVSETFLHWAGYYYIQDPVSILPVEVLGLVRGERVLDLCAAPGGKCLYIAEKVGEKGGVIANDPAEKRRRVLQANIQRLGAANVAISAYDGRVVPESKKFTAILVDAPCSGEGAQRYIDGPPEIEKDSAHREMAERQYQLLEKAYRLLAPGGRVVYSTCTYSPLENEAVVGRLLKEKEAILRKVNLDLPHRGGVVAWKNYEFNSELKKMWRCYPHHYNGGGMVFALLERPEE